MAYLPRSLAIPGPSAAAGLSTVFKSCIGGNHFHSAWKVAKVTEIFKKNSKTDVLNYRPLSLSSIPSKLLKSQVCHIIDEHLAECGIENKKQWGFCKGLSTESMLISLTESWKQALDNGLSVGAVFIDFQKALTLFCILYCHASFKLLAYLAPSTSGLCAISH